MELGLQGINEYSDRERSSSTENHTKYWEIISRFTPIILTGGSAILKTVNISSSAWKFEPFIEVLSNIGIGVGSSGILYNHLNETDRNKLMNFLKRYSVEFLLIISNVYPNVSLSKDILNQLTLCPSEILISLLLTSDALNAISLSQAHLPNPTNLDSSKFPPMLSGNTSNMTHNVLFNSAKAVVSAVSIFFGFYYDIPIVRMFGFYTGSNSLASLLTSIVETHKDKELRRLAESENFSKPSRVLQATDALIKLNKIFYPAVIGLANGIAPKFYSVPVLKKITPDVIVAGGLVGSSNHSERKDYQQKYAIQESQILEDSDISSDEHPSDNEQAIHSIASESSTLLGRVNHPTQSKWNITTEKTKNYMKNRGMEIILGGGFLIALIAFAVVVEIFDNDTIDRISMACYAGGGLLGLLLTSFVNIFMEPRNTSNPNTGSYICRTARLVKDATINTLRFYLFFNLIYPILPYLSTVSLEQNLDDTGDQNSYGNLANIIRYLGQLSLGYTWGANRIVQDSINRNLLAQTPILATSLIAQTAVLHGLGELD